MNGTAPELSTTLEAHHQAEASAALGSDELAQLQTQPHAEVKVMLRAQETYNGT